MAADAGIYNALMQPRIDSPFEAQAKAMQIQGGMAQNRLQQLQLQNAERESAAENALAGLISSGAKPDEIASGLAKQGYGKQSIAYSKQASEQQRAARQAEAEQFKQAMDKQAVIAQYAGSAKDQASWTASRNALAQMGVDVSQVPEQFDPATAQQFVQRSLTGLQQLDQAWKQKGYDLDVAKFGETVRNNKTQNSISAGNLGVARENLGLRRQEVAQGRVPAGYRAKGDGTLEPIPGGPAEKDKAPTEFQGKSATFGARAEQSDKIISGLEGRYSPAKIGAKQAAGRVGLEGAANFLLPVEEQKAEQAMRDFVNAVLRQESGAAIADSEFNNAKKQYFPQTGDSKEVIAQKAQNRKTAIEGFKKNAGKAAYTATTTLPSGWSVEEQ